MNKFVFIDIGALGGLPSHWKKYESEMKVVSFEPDTRGLLGCGDILYKESMPLTLNISVEKGKSSIFEPNKEFLRSFPDYKRYHTVKTVDFPKKRVKTLDEVSRKLKTVDFIKLDTQGSELAILEGGKDYVLPRTFGVQVEVSFCEIYKNQPMFRDVDKFMDEQGFQLIDLKRQYWKRIVYKNYFGKGQIIFGDALYFKKVNEFVFELSKMGKHKIDKIHSAIKCCLVYGMYDYAIGLLHASHISGYITAKECRDIDKVIRWMSRKKFLPGRDFIYKVLNRICESIKHTSYQGYADCDRTIGNVRDK